MMKKGFFHVVEVVIVAMLVFVILTQFYAIPRAQHSWDTAKLTVMSQDFLYALEELGVDWLDEAAVIDIMDKSVPGTVAYALSVRPTVRPHIKVGCVCDMDNYTFLQTWVLNNFTLNGIERGFSIDWINPSLIDFDLDGPDMQNDVLLFWEEPDSVLLNIGTAEAQNLSEYLKKGNGLVEFSILTQSHVNKGWHNDTFNLVWVDPSDSTRPATSGPDFPYFDPSEDGHVVEKIFMNVFPGMGGFVNFDNLVAQESVYPADGNEKRILVTQRNPYEGGTYDGKNVPLSLIDWGVQGYGRSAWMTWGDLTGANTQNRQLLKTLVIWAASGKDTVVIESEMKKSVRASMRKILNSDMYEPMRVELRLGYHF
jgi:hypothetical protein